MEPSDPEGKENGNLEKGWSALVVGFEQLLEVVENGYTKPFDHNQYMKLYTTVYNLCTTQRLEVTNVTPATEVLYQRYGELLTSYLEKRWKDPSEYQSSDQLLKEIVRLWTNHQVIVKWMVRLFSYLDRYFTKHHSRPDLNECGLKCFLRVIYDSVKDGLRNALFDSIHRERCGEPVDRDILKEAINLYIELGMSSVSLYETDFEKPFIQATMEFYEKESTRWIAENSATAYMLKAENKLFDEEQRVENYLHPTSATPLTTAVETQVLARHQKTLLEMEHSGFIALLRDRRLEDISRMYRLFHRIRRGTEPMAALMKEYVTGEGKKIVSKHSNSPELDFKAYTNDLLELHDKYRAILKDQLRNDPIFIKAVKDAFETFVNQFIQGTFSGQAKVSVSSSEMLSSYCDMLMRNADEKMGEDELEDILEQVVSLFGYISDKDLFLENYRNKLSKRLLLSTVNDDAERSLISKLKMKQGAPYTSKLEGMIQDKNHSMERKSEWKDYQADKKLQFGFEFTAQVLTTGYWPAFHIHSLEVPAAVQFAIEKYREFYETGTQSRKLTWVHSLGSATLDAHLTKGRYQLQMTAFQACVLLLFNANEELSGEEITKTLTLSWDEVKRALQSLTLGKYKLLVKCNQTGKASKAVEEEDKFQLNNDFTDKSRKLKIPNFVVKANPKASQQVQQSVEESRRHAIEACIVRIMKSRKQMEHAILITECIQQLSNHFKPDPRHIKKRIEELMAREYIERDPERTNLYRYLA